MPLHCPFCDALEDARVNGEDDRGNKVILVMFGCPFFYRFPLDQTSGDEQMQIALLNWRKSQGDEWLESVGPAMKERELANMKRNKTTS